MKFWSVTLRIACMDGDSVQAFVIEDDTAGAALDRTVATLSPDMGGGVIGWSATVLEAHARILSKESA